MIGLSWSTFTMEVESGLKPAKDCWLNIIDAPIGALVLLQRHPEDASPRLRTCRLGIQVAGSAADPPVHHRCSPYVVRDLPVLVYPVGCLCDAQRCFCRRDATVDFPRLLGQHLLRSVLQRKAPILDRLGPRNRSSPKWDACPSINAFQERAGRRTGMEGEVAGTASSRQMRLSGRAGP